MRARAVHYSLSAAPFALCGAGRLNPKISCTNVERAVTCKRCIECLAVFRRIFGG